VGLVSISASRDELATLDILVHRSPERRQSKALVLGARAIEHLRAHCNMPNILAQQLFSGRARLALEIVSRRRMGGSGFKEKNLGTLSTRMYMLVDGPSFQGRALSLWHVQAQSRKLMMQGSPSRRTSPKAAPCARPSLRRCPRLSCEHTDWILFVGDPRRIATSRTAQKRRQPVPSMISRKLTPFYAIKLCMWCVVIHLVATSIFHHSHHLGWWCRPIRGRASTEL
jgi:hypothetical protein